MADLSGVVSGARQAIGPYFSLVSVLPSLLFVAYVDALAGSGAWGGAVNLHRAALTLQHLGLSGLTLLVLASLGLGVVLHPIQFTMVQLLEGYWGCGRLAQAARLAFMARHRRRLEALDRYRVDDEERADADTRRPDVIARLSLADEAERLVSFYPHDPQLIMPTRLGNVLRRYETAAGRPFGMRGLDVLPYVALVATDRHVDYLNDQRSGMDLSIRVSLMSALACAVSALFLWDNGAWLLLALVPYAATYLSYRGAVITAAHYGTAICALIALNRSQLYERLRVPQPATLASEVALNKSLEGLFTGAGVEARVRLVPSKPPAGDHS